MKKTILIVGTCLIFLNIAYGVQPGGQVQCSLDDETCNGCAQTDELRNLFSFDNLCKVNDCTASAIGDKLNGWVCLSCSYASGQQLLTQGQYFDGKTCVQSCPDGQYANEKTDYICQTPNPGIEVECGFGLNYCVYCGVNMVYDHFTYVKDTTRCTIPDCSANIIRTNLNGWACHSCSGASGTGNIPSGQYFDGKTCVQQCPPGQEANQSNAWVCSPPPNPGSPVACSSDQNCTGCGVNNQLSMFSYQSGNNCAVIDCHKDTIKNVLLGIVNGFICNSCGGATGTDNIIGKYYNPNTRQCVEACPLGYSASLKTKFVCQRDPTPVPCSQDSSTCNGCGDTPQIQQLFTRGDGNTCVITDCSASVIGSNLNGWVCNSCSTTDVNGINITNGVNFTGKTCSNYCPKGQSSALATNYNCKVVNSGASVTCSKDSSTCKGCGASFETQHLFTHGKGSNCQVFDCSVSTVGQVLNGWICNSCKAAAGSNNISAGQYFDGTTCVQNCPQGQDASIDTEFVCKFPPTPGQNVACSKDQASCHGCGSSETLQSLFSKKNDSFCSVTDCSLTAVGSNLNGWVCNSCSTATGNRNIAAGQFYDGSTCVTSCPKGQVASIETEFVCQQAPTPGKDVACSKDQQTCFDCGSSNIIQGLFTRKINQYCSVTDCKQSTIGSNLNGWICNSCSTATGDNNIPVGQYYNGVTCVTSCPKGQIANEATGFVCQVDPHPGQDVECSTDSSTCNSCGSSESITNLFSHRENKNCMVSDCNLTAVGSNLNGWVCNSCSTASGSDNIAIGKYFDGKNCVASCPTGSSASASTNFICKTDSNPNPANIETSYSNLIGFYLILLILIIVV